LPSSYLTLWTLYGDPGEQPEIVEAIDWFRLKANSGEPGAQYALEIVYADGRCVPQDNIEAYKWLSLAAAALSPPPGAHVDSQLSLIASQMTPEQLAEAERLVNRWKPASNCPSPE